jgi:hypothetical protein
MKQPSAVDHAMICGESKNFGADLRADAATMFVTVRGCLAILLALALLHVVGRG